MELVEILAVAGGGSEGNLPAPWESCLCSGMGEWGCPSLLGPFLPPPTLSSTMLIDPIPFLPLGPLLAPFCAALRHQERFFLSVHPAPLASRAETRAQPPHQSTPREHKQVLCKSVFIGYKNIPV